MTHRQQIDSRETPVDEHQTNLVRAHYDSHPLVSFSFGPGDGIEKALHLEKWWVCFLMSWDLHLKLRYALMHVDI